jgi:hypothetical protein
MNDIVWRSRSDYPEDDRDIIVKDDEDKEYDNHYWCGHCYYDYVENPDCSCDGYPSDVNIISWRYK